MAPGLHFTKEETESLINMFRSLGKVNPARPDKLERTQVREQLHVKFGVTDDLILDRIVRVFDTDSDNYVSQSEWLHGLSIFLRGTIEEKKQFCFKVYDLNDDGFITKEEVFNLLKNSMAKLQTEEDPDEGIKDLVDITIKKMDLDKDNKIGPDDFSSIVSVDPLYLEHFGACLPEQEFIESFLATHCRKPVTGN
ncbi:EF-hand calcium-binding domain-containing protein 1-like isoform X2 [Asterias rubens]|uniref:EF-hand calcium-binding domain-containing protein 1-like isoform X2 n=1 Tax=Asterias rubens TaxID=7604 RepID=UPI001454E941|nr:EF-hand calcium-binding domain-containing protein 1-like isoform X2 [Asterias rubens]